MLIIDLFVIIFGLILGSFFNVVAIRLLKNESLVFPPSHCVNCNHQLHTLDLVPVFSYLFLKGKCRYCKSPISSLYPFGEFLTAVSIFFVYKNVGISLELIPALLLTILLVISVLTDIREQLILDIVTLPMLGLLIFSRLFIGTNLFGTIFLVVLWDFYYYYSLQLSVKEAWAGEILNYMLPLVLL